LLSNFIVEVPLSYGEAGSQKSYKISAKKEMFLGLKNKKV